MICKLERRDWAIPLFRGWEETETMIRSCLQGVMGNLYGDSEAGPSSVMALLGDFAFLAGKARAELVTYRPAWRGQDEFLILVPQSDEWAEMIEKVYGEKARRVTRYATKKEPDAFDGEKLAAMAAGELPEGCELKMMDEELFLRCKEIGWCRDWVSQYDTYVIYREYGVGVVILKDGEPVSGASSYTSYTGGIEIEIDTRQDFRRKGLARICGANLILECLKRGWYPSWDAQNKGSLALAEQLGYRFDHEYTAYETG